MVDSIDSSKNQAGEKFLATVATPIRVDDQTVVPKGSDVYVTLVESKSAGKIKGKSELQVELDSVKVQGRTYPMKSSVVQAMQARKHAIALPARIDHAGLGAMRSRL